LRSRVCPATENARSLDENYIRGGVNEFGNPLPSNTEARFADFSDRRNNVPYSSAFARITTNIPSLDPPNILTSRNIPSQCLISAPRNMSTDTVVTNSFGNTSEIQSNMPANAIKSNYVTSATAMLPIDTSGGLPTRAGLGAPKTQGPPQGFGALKLGVPKVRRLSGPKGLVPTKLGNPKG
jgi:hypothetical protein